MALQCVDFVGTICESVNGINLIQCDACHSGCIYDGVHQSLFGTCDITVSNAFVCHGVTTYLCVLLRIVACCVCLVLECDTRTTIGKHESVTASVCLLHISGYLAKLRIELLHNLAVLIGTSCKHCLAAVLLDLVICIAQAAHTRLCAVCHCYVIATHTCLDREVSTCCIVNGVREVEGRTCCCSILRNVLLELIYGCKWAITGSDDHTKLFCILLCYLDACFLQCLKTRDDLHQTELVELSVECHLQTIFIVIFFSNICMYRRCFRLCLCIDLIDIVGNAISKWADDTKTCDINLLIVLSFLHIARLLREDDTCIASAKCKGVRHYIVQILFLHCIRHEIECACLLTERLDILLRISDRWWNLVLCQSLDCENCLDRTGCT